MFSPGKSSKSSAALVWTKTKTWYFPNHDPVVFGPKPNQSVSKEKKRKLWFIVFLQEWTKSDIQERLGSSLNSHWLFKHFIWGHHSTFFTILCAVSDAKCGFEPLLYTHTHTHRFVFQKVWFGRHPVQMAPRLMEGSAARIPRADPCKANITQSHKYRYFGVKKVNFADAP